MCSEETEYRENRPHGRSRALAVLVSLAALFCFSLWPQDSFFFFLLEIISTWRCVRVKNGHGPLEQEII